MFEGRRGTNRPNMFQSQRQLIPRYSGFVTTYDLRPTEVLDDINVC